MSESPVPVDPSQAQPARGSLWSDFVAFLRDIRLEHSLFALPFALLGALLACEAGLSANVRAHPYPGKRELLYLVICMVAARSAAMGFNRLVDRKIDAKNPRTAKRALASGKARVSSYVALVALGSIVFWLVAGLFNPLTQRLAPLALLILFFYSYTKRFTAFCHIFLGLALGISPVAAWVALCNGIPVSPSPYLLMAIVILWVAGFDILYATMDVDVDKAQGLHAVPQLLGVPKALKVARWLHEGMAVALLVFYLITPGLGWGFGVSVLISLGLLAYEHALVTPDDLKKVNTAFFTVNAVLGFILSAGATVDWVILGST